MSREQSFGSCISKKRLEQLELDFSPENIQTRQKFYDKILEAIFVKDEVKNSYIAGGGFLIKYNANADASRKYPDKFESHKKNSTLNVYLKCCNKIGLQVYQECKTNLKPTFKDCRFADANSPNAKEQNGIFARLDTQKIPENFLQELHEEIYFDLRFTSYDIFATLNNFTFHPSKIGYNYQKGILFSRWFLVGGNLRIYKYCKPSLGARLF